MSHYMLIVAAAAVTQSLCLWTQFDLEHHPVCYLIPSFSNCASHIQEFFPTPRSFPFDISLFLFYKFSTW